MVQIPRPWGGKEGTFSTARQLEERLTREKKTNIGLKIESNPGGHGFIVAGRGELHLAVLIENLRREGYEMQVGKPQVILKEIDGVLCEPVEEVTIEIDKSYIGIISQGMGRRRAQFIETTTNSGGTTRIIFKISSRNLLGFRSDMLTKTRGNGLIASRFLGYFPVTPAVEKVRNGVLVAWDKGVSTAYALTTVQERGTPFIGPGVAVYEGMIIGLNKRGEDMDINVAKQKKMTNVHSETADIAIALNPPTILSLEQALDFIEDDELVEVTPQSLRLRKRYLSKVARVQAKRKK